MARIATWLFYTAAIAFFATFFLWPIGRILIGGFFDADGTFTLDYLCEVFVNPLYREGLWNAFLLALFSTLGAVCIALPLAWIVNRFDFFAKRFFQIAVLLPLMMPPFVGALGMRQLFGVYGAFNAVLLQCGIIEMPVDWLGGCRFAAMAALLSLSLYPIVYLNVLAALSNCDPSLDEAAENLGCRGLKKFFKITFPLIRPGLFSGAILVFIWALTELGVPLLFDYARIASVQVFDGLNELGGNPFPYALITVLLVCSLLLYAAGRRLFGNRQYAMLAKASGVSCARPVGGWKSFACAGFFGAVIFCALLPHMAVVLISFAADWYKSVLPEFWTLQNYATALTEGMTVGAVRNSLGYAAGATILALILGCGIAFIVQRTRLPGRRVLDAFAMLPLAVPGLVLAFGYLAMTGKGELFSFLNPIENPVCLLIIAYGMRRLPFMVRCVAAGLEQISPAYEEAAQCLGCPPWRAMMRITLPLLSANVLAGASLVFSQAMLEVSDSLVLAQKQEFYPITKAIYELANYLGDGPFLACALGVWAMALLGAAFWGAGKLLGKRLGRLFSAK